MKQSTLDLLAYFGQGEEQVALPDGYVRIDYLESTGAQYIDTGFIPDNESKAFVDFAYTETSTVPSAGAIFGERGTSYTDRAFAVGTNEGITSSTYVMIQFGTASVGMLARPAPDLNRHTWLFSKEGGFYDSVRINSMKQTPFTGAYSCWMFGRQASVNSMNKCRLYQVKLWQADELVHQYVPAIRISDNKPGMYDTVNAQFLVNQGTGDDFKTPLDALGYRRVKCIKGNTNQKVDTGILGNNDNLDCETEFRVSSYLQYGAIYGAYVGEQANTTRAIQGSTSAGSTLLYTNSKASGSSTTVMNTTTGQWHYVRANRTRILMDDRTIAVTTTTQGTALGNISIKLFNAGVTSTNVTISFKYFCIYDSGDRVRCMLPVVRISDSKPGMYDMVTNTFMANSGSGELAYEELDQ